MSQTLLPLTIFAMKPVAECVDELAFNCLKSPRNGKVALGAAVHVVKPVSGDVVPVAPDQRSAAARA